ncbi:hypothetical protein JCM15519_20610 [Fundidesulfovibrio butyratiphilus]
MTASPSDTHRPRGPESVSRESPRLHLGEGAGEPCDLLPATVGVILVNYRGARLTMACLDALSRLHVPPARVVVVDNGSRDESAALLSRESGAGRWTPRPEILALRDNLGFAAGNNAALRLLLADRSLRAFWLLNNDALPDPQALDALCRRMNRPDRPGACGSILLYEGTPRRIQCAGGGRVSRITGTTRSFLEGKVPSPDLPRACDAVEARLDYLCGASLLVRAEAAERTGPLDEAYFLYYEDVDWCLRMRARGVCFAVAPDSFVVHREGGTTGARSFAGDGVPVRPARIDYLSLRNRVRLVRRFFPAFAPCVAASFTGVLLKRIRQGQRDRLGLVVRALWDGLTGNMGPPGAM